MTFQADAAYVTLVFSDGHNEYYQNTLGTNRIVHDTFVAHILPRWDKNISFKTDDEITRYLQREAGNINRDVPFRLQFSNLDYIAITHLVDSHEID